MLFLYAVVGLALLLAAMALGATVTLRAVRATQADSASMQQFSKDVATISMDGLAATEREASRDRSLSEMARTMEALNVTVGQLYFKLKEMQSESPAGVFRSPARGPAQWGETPPSSTSQPPPQRPERPLPPPLPPEGLAETPKGSTPAAEATRANALAERT